MKDTREQIKSFRLEHPGLTLREIGLKVGRTRERVRQVLVEEGLPTKASRPNRLKHYCLNCGRKLPYGNSKFCSRGCYNNYRHTTLTCDFCGRRFERFKSQAAMSKARYRHTFCSKTCQGRWFAKWYGLGTWLTRKLDYERIRHLYDEGYNGLDIARLTGEKPRSIYSAIYRMGLRFRRPMSHQKKLTEIRR